MLREMTDLKSYFSQASSVSRPSTRASGVCNDPGIQVEVQENNSEDANGEVEGINQFNPDHIISDPGLHIPIDSFAPNIRDDVRRAFIAKGPTQPIGQTFLSHMIKGAFKNIGLDNIVGWNIVWRRIRLIASIVTFLSTIEWMINFAMMHLQKLASHSGEMFIRHFQNMLVGLIAYTILQQHHSMIFVTKGQVLVIRLQIIVKMHWSNMRHGWKLP
jgi:hypothetical protein